MLIIALPAVTTKVTAADAHPNDTDTALPGIKPDNTHTVLPASTLPDDEINAAGRLSADIDIEHTTLANANDSKDYQVKVPAVKMIEIIPARTTKLKTTPLILVSISQTKITSLEILLILKKKNMLINHNTTLR
jgi:hypothetical protein